MAFTPKAVEKPKGFYTVPGYPQVLVNKKGEVFLKESEKITLGGVAGQYRRVSVKVGEGRKLCYVHDLVCRAFYGPPKAGEVGCHQDDDRLNNAKSNLKWETQSKNIKDTYVRGLRQPTTGKEGYSNPNWVEW
jgi:hypothetical protein